MDDDPVLRKTIRVALGISGFAVEEARHGQEAVETVQRRRFDLVVLDMNMPGLSGLDTCRQIRSLAPCTGIIMLTVRDTEEDKVRALEAVADDFMTKPARLVDLKARITAVHRKAPEIGRRPFESERDPRCNVIALLEREAHGCGSRWPQCLFV